MRNFSERNCTEKQNTHFVYCIFFYFGNRAVYEIMWEDMVERGRLQMRL